MCTLSLFILQGTIIINVNSISENKKNKNRLCLEPSCHVPNTKYVSVCTCVSTHALHCIRMYSAVCCMPVEYTYACEGTGVSC